MKHVAVTLSTLRRPSIVLFLVGLGVGCYYLWMPLFYFFMGINALHLLNAVLKIGFGILTRGWLAVRLELMQAMQEIKEEDAVAAEAARQRVEAYEAKLRAEELANPPNLKPELALVPDPKPENETDDKPEPTKLRVINGGG